MTCKSNCNYLELTDFVLRTLVVTRKAGSPDRSDTFPSSKAQQGTALCKSHSHSVATNVRIF